MLREFTQAHRPPERSLQVAIYAALRFDEPSELHVAHIIMGLRECLEETALSHVWFRIRTKTHHWDVLAGDIHADNPRRYSFDVWRAKEDGERIDKDSAFDDCLDTRQLIQTLKTDKCHWDEME